MNNITALATVNGSNIRATVQGAIVTRSDKGTLRLKAQSLKDYRDMLVNGKHPKLDANGEPVLDDKGQPILVYYTTKDGSRYTNKMANDSYKSYRAAVSANLNKSIIAQLQAGEISFESVGANATHQLTTAKFVKPTQQKADKVVRVTDDAAAIYGLTPEEVRIALSSVAAKRAAAAGTASKGAIDVPTTEAPATEASAQAPEHVTAQ